MVKRKRIALNYQVDYDSSAGIVIYIQNLVKGFALLEDRIQPELLIIYSESSPIEEIKELNYKYINFYCYKPIRNSFLKKAINKLSRELTGKNIIRRYDFPDESTLLYPYFYCTETHHFKSRMYWKPDFQEMYYPNFITTKELDFVKDYLNEARIHPKYEIVFSSEDSLNDYKKFFSPFENIVKVMKFVSILPKLPTTDSTYIRNKYSLPEKYFIIANQFWPHKNHQLVFEAIVKVREKYPDVCIACSGKQTSYRDGNYFQNLQNFILQNNLQNNVVFLGFIPRIDQLLLIRNAQAVIQPSLFEGWSTVIEDCKALGQFVLASDLKVNIEQSNQNILFFNQNNAKELANAIEKVLAGQVDRSPYDYTKNINKFADDLINVFDLN